MQGQYTILKVINMKSHEKLMKNKYMINSTDAEKMMMLKGCSKIQYPFIIKTLNKVNIEGMCLSIIKVIYDKPIANIRINAEILSAGSPRSGR